jgi:predicted nucleic acid-binding protein
MGRRPGRDALREQPGAQVALNLIDTAVWVDWLKDRDNAVTARLVELRRDPESLATTQPVVMEVLQYLNSAAADRVERILDSLVMSGDVW